MKKALALFIVLAFAASLFGCAQAPDLPQHADLEKEAPPQESAAPAEDILPLEDGNWWEFKDSIDDIWKITSSKDGEDYLLEWVFSVGVLSSMKIKKEDGNYYATEIDGYDYSEPILILKDGVKGGDSWTVDTEWIADDEVRIPHKWEVSVRGPGKVMTDLGLKTCYMFEYAISKDGELNKRMTWYLEPGKGFCKTAEELLTFDVMDVAVLKASNVK
jgi:hypothetical protein